MKTYKLPTVLIALVIMLMGGSLIRPESVAAVPASDVNGNTYTSPQFGYSITWDTSWLVSDDTSDDGFDILNITNGFSSAQLIGFDSFSGNARIAASVFGTQLNTQSGISNFEVVSTSDASDSLRSFETIRYTYTYDDGTTAIFMEYIEARTVVPGQSVVIFDGLVSEEYFEIAQPEFDTLLATLVIPSTDDATTGDTAIGGGNENVPADSDVGDTPPAALAQGEDAPVFITGPWRIAIAGAVQNASIGGVGLKEKDGKDWVAVVIDVTNWGPENATFPAADFSIQLVGSKTHYSLATGSTAKVARELGLPKDSNVIIDANETQRLVLVFSVTQDGLAPSLVFNNQAFPINDILAFDMKADSLGVPAGPPALQEATLVSTDDGKTIKVQYEGESKSRRITLLGIDSSATAEEAADAIMAYRGDTIWLETDPSIEPGATPAVYVWIDNAQGERIMLNQILLEDGVARVGFLPSDARFAKWLGLVQPTAHEKLPATPIAED